MRTSVMAETLITAPGRMLSQEWARELHHEPGARRRRRLRDGDCRARQGRLRAPLPGRRHRGARRTRSLRTGLGTGRQRVARRRVAAPGTGRRARLPQRRSARGLAGHAAHPDARMGPEAARRHRRGRGTAGSRTALVRSPLDRRAGAARRPDAGARVRGRAGKDRGGAVLDSLARRGRRETGEGARRLLGLCNRARDERIDVHGADRRLDRAEDPRARVLRRTAIELGSPRVEVAEALEQAAIAALREKYPDRPLETNVEFWGAIVLEIARIPAAITPALFACARTGGWSAHIVEQKLTGRLIRPSAIYVGPAERHLSEL